MVPRPAAVLDGAPFLPLVSHVWKNKGSKGHVWLSVSGGIEKIDGEGKLIWEAGARNMQAWLPTRVAQVQRILC